MAFKGAIQSYVGMYRVQGLGLRVWESYKVCTLTQGLYKPYMVKLGPLTLNPKPRIYIKKGHFNACIS